MAPDDRKSSHRSTADQEMQKIVKVGAVLAVSAVLFMVGFTVLVHTEIVKLYPKTMAPETLKGFAARVEYSLRYQSLLVFWLMFNVFVTIYGRFRGKALNPLEPETERRVEAFKNILTNSFESIVISVFSQLIFVSFAEPETILKYIPLVNVVQFIGRIAFFAGYPMRRAFGFSCTLWPNVLMSGYNIYKLGNFLNFY